MAAPLAEAPNPWHNYSEPLNVDGIAGIGPRDALFVINEINGRIFSGANSRLKVIDQGVPGSQFDVNNDRPQCLRCGK